MTARDEDPVYLNNAGTSWPKPKAVAERVSQALSSGPWELREAVEEAQNTIARFLGLPSPEGLLLTSGCTSALSTAIESLPWQPGESLVTSALEHHAVDGPAQRLSRDRGVMHLSAPYEPGTPFDLDFLRDTLGTESVRLVAISGASNVTGEVLPVRAIADLCHEHGALCLVDAAQLAGIVPINVTDLGADLLAIAGHKGPLGPQGIGALWAREDVQFACPSAVCEAGDRAEAPRARGPDRPGYCDVGGINLAGLLGLAAGIEWLTEHPEGSKRARSLAARLVATLRERDDCIVYGGEGPRTAAVSFKLAHLPLHRAEKSFFDEGIVLRAGTHCAPRAIEALDAGDGTIRVSFGPFNDESDPARVVEAVDAIAESGF